MPNKKKHPPCDHRDVVGGRIVLAIMTIVFCGLGYYVFTTMPLAHRPQLLASLILTGVWGGGLLIAIWCEQRWARNILMGVLLFGLLLAGAVIMDFHDQRIPIPQQLLIGMGVGLVALVTLVWHPAIRELTRKMR